jgi:hypothetical protein
MTAEEPFGRYARMQKKLLDIANNTEANNITDEYFEGESAPQCVPELFEIIGSVAGARPESSSRLTSFVMVALHRILEPISAAINLVEKLIESPGDELETAVSSLGNIWPRSIPLLRTTGKLAVAVAKLRRVLAEEVGITPFDAIVAGAVAGSPLCNFRHVWQRARNRAVMDPVFTDFRGWRVIRAAAADNVAELGPLLRDEDVNAEFWLEAEPKAMHRRPGKVTFLDVAMSSGAVRSAKLLMVFHQARVTEETFAMALSSGNLELIRLAWDRLPDPVRMRRADHAMTAAEWHQLEPLMWLLREASPVELELFSCFALERHLADGIMAVLDGQLKPWLRRSREAALRWGPAQKLDSGRAPRTVEVPRFSKRLGLGVVFDSRSGAAFFGQAEEVDVDAGAGWMGAPLLIKYSAELPVEVGESELIFVDRIRPGERTFSKWPDFIRHVRGGAPLLILIEGYDGFALGAVVAQPLTSSPGVDTASYVFTLRPTAEVCSRWRRYSSADDRGCMIQGLEITASFWSLRPGTWDDESYTASEREWAYGHTFGCMEVWRL